MNALYHLFFDSVNNYYRKIRKNLIFLIFLIVSFAAVLKIAVFIFCIIFFKIFIFCIATACILFFCLYFKNTPKPLFPTFFILIIYY